MDHFPLCLRFCNGSTATGDMKSCALMRVPLPIGSR